MKKLIVSNLQLLILFLSFASCSSSDLKQTTTRFSGNAMTIDYNIIIGRELRSDQKKSVQEVVQNTFAEIDAIYNKWNPDSEISRLNQLKSGISVKISGKLENFLYETERLVSLTEGRFDPTIEPVQKLWKKCLEKGKVPEISDIENAMQAVGFDKIHVNNGIFYKDHDETSLDLGGIAKGYTVDLLASRLNEMGFSDLFVEWGGEIKATGRHPENRPWHIFIAKLNDSNPDHAIAHLDLENKSIATSGDYLQNWTVIGGTRYFHVIDPKNGFPLEITENSIASTSVVAENCAVADAIATALMLFPDSESAALWGERVKVVYPEVQFWIVSRSSAASIVCL